MKFGIVSIAFFIILLAGSCKSSAPFQDPFTREQINWYPSLVLEIGDAERILGNPSRVEKVTSYLDEGTKTYLSAFRDDWIDPQTNKTGVLYYMYEEYQTADAAKTFLDVSLKDNHVAPSDGVLVGTGVELHYMKGGDVVRMVMIRKENRLIRLKVNQVTSRYNLAKFEKVALELANHL